MFFRFLAAGFVLMAALQWTSIRPLVGFPNYRGCDARGYDDDHYLAFCDNSYGAYDAAAIYLDLESVQKSIRAANVIILGNSRAVFGFSTETTNEYFARKGVPYYMLAFQHDEQYRFPLAVLKAARARPKAIIISADPFFDPKLSRPAREAMGPNGTAHARYRQLLQKIHHTLCGWTGLADSWRHDYCGGHGMTVFRSRQNGQWSTSGLPSEHYPVEPLRHSPPSISERYVAAATSFRNAIGLPAECVILTQVPSPSADLSWLEALSRQTGMPAVSTYLDGLTTFDRLHLDHDGAEKWSAPFLREIEPILNNCLKDSRSAK
jgi:hypothetical protein